MVLNLFFSMSLFLFLGCRLCNFDYYLFIWDPVVGAEVEGEQFDRKVEQGMEWLELIIFKDEILTENCFDFLKRRDESSDSIGCEFEYDGSGICWSNVSAEIDSIESIIEFRLFPIVISRQHYLNIIKFTLY